MTILFHLEEFVIDFSVFSIEAGSMGVAGGFLVFPNGIVIFWPTLIKLG